MVENDKSFVAKQLTKGDHRANEHYVCYFVFAEQVERVEDLFRVFIIVLYVFSYSLHKRVLVDGSLVVLVKEKVIAVVMANVLFLKIFAYEIQNNFPKRI